MIIDAVNDISLPFEGLTQDLIHDHHTDMYLKGLVSVTTGIGCLEYCKRKTWFTYHTQVRIPASEMFVPQLGSFVHTGLEKSNKANRKHIKQSTDKDFFTEVRLVSSNEYPRQILGTTDLVILDNETDSIKLYDYKFTRTYPKYTPRLTDMLQILIYNEMLKNSFDVRKFKLLPPAIVYIRKDAQKYKYANIVAGGHVQLENIDGYSDAMGRYFDMSFRNDEEYFSSKYGGKLDYLPYVQDGELVALKSTRAYMKAMMIEIDRIIDDTDYKNYEFEGREGSYVNEQGKVAQDSKWKCRYCTYAGFCTAREGVGERGINPDIQMLYTNSREFSRDMGVKFKSW